MTRTGWREKDYFLEKSFFSQAHCGQESVLQADYPQELSEDRVPSGAYLSALSAYLVVDLASLFNHQSAVDKRPQ